MEGLVGELQLYTVHAQQLFVLLDQAVAGLLEHTHQCVLVQIVQHSDDRQTADQLRDQAKLDQIVRLHLAQQGTLGILRVVLQAAAEAQCRAIGAAQDVFIQAIKGTAADEQDVGGIDLDKLLLGVLAATVGRHVAHGALQDLQQRLLHTLAAHITGDGGILALAGDFVDLIDVDDTHLCLLHIKIRRLKQLEQDVLHILTHIARLGQGGGIRNGEGHPQHLGQGLSQQSLADTGGAQQQNVGLLQFHIRTFAAQDALIMVVNGDRQHTLGLILTNDILVQPVLDLSRSQDIDIQTIHSLHPGTACAAARAAVCFRVLRLIREQIMAQTDALAADVDTGADDHPFHFVLMLAAEAAHQVFFIFAGIVVCHNCYSLFWVFARRALPRAFQFQRWAMTSSIRPYSLASSAVI